MENRILVLALRGRDGTVIARLLSRRGYSAEICLSLDGLVHELSQGASAAVLTEESLKNVELRPLLTWLDHQEPWSDLPFVLLATKRSGVRPPAAMRILESLGNVIVLERPIHSETLESAIHSAMRVRRRQYESRARQIELMQAEAHLIELNASLEDRIALRTSELSAANQRLTLEVAERERAQAALLQAQKMEAVGQLTGGIAHDFNNILAAVMGGVDLIRRNADDPHRIRLLAGKVTQAAERGAKLTGQLLAFSRAQRLELKPLKVSELISEMRDLLASTVGPLIRLEIDLDVEDTAVLSDRTQLEMAVLNLVINGRDAMPEGGQMTIVARCRRLRGDAELAPGDYVELSVGDTGSGMPPDVLSRALDPFFTTKEVGKGTGLGLSQVYGLARQAGGTIRISSEVGKGTTVQLYLQRTEMEPEQAGKMRTQRTSQPLPARILVVDDDDDVRRIVAESVAAIGYCVQEAQNGPQALALVANEPLDLAIVDFAMPGMNGAEVAIALRGIRPDLPVVFVSGYSDTAVIEDALGKDVQILRKPFTIDDLEVLLDACLQRANISNRDRAK